MKRIVYILLFLVILLLGITFAIKNPQSVELNYYFGFNETVRLATLVWIILAIGMILGVLLTSIWVLRVRRQLGKARREIKKLEAGSIGHVGRSLSTADSA